MLPCDLSTDEVFTELRCPSSPVDILSCFPFIAFTMYNIHTICLLFVYHMYIIFISLLCNRSNKVDVLIASLVFDVVCVDVCQLEVEKQTIKLFCFIRFLPFVITVLLFLILIWFET